MSSLQPLLAASPAIQVHVAAASGAFVLGLIQFAAPKGTLPHRTVGWIWVALMAVVALTSFFLTGIQLIGRWSPIHLLSIFTLIMLPIGVRYARRGSIEGHRKTMKGLFLGALVLAGLFTLIPGRLMFNVLF